MTARALALALAPDFEVRAAGAALAAGTGGRVALEQALGRLRRALETGDDEVTRRAASALHEAVLVGG